VTFVSHGSIRRPCAASPRRRTPVAG
jgi:hypothetical protein